MGIQASVILLGMYIKRVRGQLQGKEDKKRRKIEGSHLLGDGHVKWCTSDTFMDLCIKEDDHRVAEKLAKVQRGDKQSLYSATLTKQKKKNNKIWKRNKGQKIRFYAGLKEWEANVEQAQIEGLRHRAQKPILKAFGIEKLLEKLTWLVVDLEGDGVVSGSGQMTDVVVHQESNHLRFACTSGEGKDKGKQIINMDEDGTVCSANNDNESLDLQAENHNSEDGSDVDQIWQLPA